jgi:aromatic-L-amino-acid decarboxylase
MDTEEFRMRGKEMVDYICDYMDGLSSRRVTPNVEPGYLRNILPSQAPQHAEDWDTIMADVDTKIMPGVNKRIFSLLLTQHPLQTSDV